MSSVVCNMGQCPYRSSVFCKRETVMINRFGQCEVWFDKNGGMRPVPFIPPEAEPETPERSVSA